MRDEIKHKNEVKGQTFNNVGRFQITRHDLPLSCPLPSASLWDAHPRVYLPIEETGKATCPYCSAHYVLKDFSKEISKE